MARAAMSISSRFTLSNGAGIPYYGFGTYKMKDEEIITKSIDSTIGLGTRLIDTAAIYRNEGMVGGAIRKACVKHSIDRSELFLTTKLYTNDHGYDKALKALDTSLQALGMDYVDLYLIHWPGVSGLAREDVKNAEIRRESWRALEELYKSGKAKAIGVSNYTVKHLEGLLSHATVKPHVLQSECHPLLPQREVRALCAQHGIFFQAYSSLGTGDASLLKHEKLLSIASKYPNKTPAQILLAWALQEGMGIIPKSSSEARVKENADLFDIELSPEDRQTLNTALDTNHHFCWNPDDVA